jgi:hypothetical protein
MSKSKLENSLCGIGFGLALLLASQVAVPGDVVAQDAKPAEPAKIDPAAVDLIQKSAEFLANRKQLSFDWFSSYDEIIDGKKLTFMRSGSNVLLRDKGFYSRVEGDTGVREYFYDGRQVAVVAADDGFYAVQEFDKGFEALIDAVREATDEEIPLHAIMVRDLPDRVVDGLTSATYVGRADIAGAQAHHLAFSDAEEDWQVWISTDENEPVPLVIVGTESSKPGWPQYRAYLSDWAFDGEIDSALFTFKPEDGVAKIAFPELKAKAASEAKPDDSSGAAPQPASSPSDGTSP